MNLNEIYSVLDQFAPKCLSDEYCKLYDAYDNSGILIDTGENIEKILFSLDLSKGAVVSAKESGCRLIVTHHPVIYGGITSLAANQPSHANLLACIQAGISVVSMHLNLDCADGGVDESLACAVRKAAGAGETQEVRMRPVRNGAYGRAYDILPCTAAYLADALSEELQAKRTMVYGGEQTVKRAVSCCGAGVDEQVLQFALRQGADVLISSDIKHHLLTAALEMGLAVIAPTHYAAENYGFKKYYEKISKAISLPCVFYTDGRLL